MWDWHGPGWTNTGCLLEAPVVGVWLHQEQYWGVTTPTFRAFTQDLGDRYHHVLTKPPTLFEKHLMNVWGSFGCSHQWCETVVKPHYVSAWDASWQVRVIGLTFFYFWQWLKFVHFCLIEDTLVGTDGVTYNLVVEALLMSFHGVEVFRKCILMVPSTPCSIDVFLALPLFSWGKLTWESSGGNSQRPVSRYDKDHWHSACRNNELWHLLQKWPPFLSNYRCV